MSSPFGPMTLVCNARAGSGGVGKSLPAVQSKLDDRGLEYVVRYTDRPGHATEIAREVLHAGSRFVVAVGGDGTVHEVVNGMIENDRPINPEAAFGVVAAGTGSDFIKTFGLPTAPGYAAAHLDGSDAFPIDIGKITYMQDGSETIRYFANIAEVGIGAAVVARAARLPRWLGPTVYFCAFWMTIPRHKTTRVSIDLISKKYEGPMNNLVVANGQFFGGGMKIAPKAAPTDGLLDVLIEHVRKRESIAILPKVFKGEHLPHPDIEQAKRAELSITSERPLPIEADGEVLGTTPARFEILKEAIRLKV